MLGKGDEIRAMLPLSRQIRRPIKRMGLFKLEMVE
jgi:hypothetical protein